MQLGDAIMGLTVPEEVLRTLEFSDPAVRGRLGTRVQAETTS